jgi:hypothetical protein
MGTFWSGQKHNPQAEGFPMKELLNVNMLFSFPQKHTPVKGGQWTPDCVRAHPCYPSPTSLCLHSSSVRCRSTGEEWGSRVNNSIEWIKCVTSPVIITSKTDPFGVTEASLQTTCIVYHRQTGSCFVPYRRLATVNSAHRGIPCNFGAKTKARASLVYILLHLWTTSASGYLHVFLHRGSLSGLECVSAICWWRVLMLTVEIIVICRYGTFHPEGSTASPSTAQVLGFHPFPKNKI